MPTSSEIDNVSLSALKDVFLSPAGIALEVHYLDRTEGSEVNMHRFDPVNPGGYTIGTIRLLYRPGHYDILYKAEDLPVQPMVVPTYLQYSSVTHQEPVYDLGVSDFMTMIPGMSYATPQQAWASNASYGSDFFPASTTVQQCTQPLPAPAVSTAQPQLQLQTQPVYIPATPSHLVAPPIQLPQEMAVRTAPHGILAQSNFPHQLTSSPFRRSRFEYEMTRDFAQAPLHLPLQTSIFRKSVNPLPHPFQARESC